MQKQRQVTNYATCKRVVEKDRLTPHKLAFSIFRKSTFDSPSWKGIWNWCI